MSVPPKMGKLVVISLFQLSYKKLQSIGFSKGIHRRILQKQCIYCGSGTFLAERAKKASCFKMNFHESHKIGFWCHMRAQKLSDSTLTWPIFVNL